MKVTDPVCGMQIEKAAAREEHDGTAYFFCSEACHHLFMSAPERYVTGAHEPGSIPEAGDDVEGDHHE